MTKPESETPEKWDEAKRSSYWYDLYFEEVGKRCSLERRLRAAIAQNSGREVAEWCAEIAESDAAWLRDRSIMFDPQQRAYAEEVASRIESLSAQVEALKSDNAALVRERDNLQRLHNEAEEDSAKFQGKLIDAEQRAASLQAELDAANAALVTLGNHPMDKVPASKVADDCGGPARVIEGIGGKP